MRVHHTLRWTTWAVLPLAILAGSLARAEGEPAKDPSVLERIGNTAKKVGKKIEQGFTKAGTKLKRKKVGEKIEQKLNKAVTKTGEGFKKAGRKLDQKLNR